MRTKTYSIFYLAIMAIYIIRPVMPYIEYAINKDYIAKYLCVQRDIPDNSCDGMCYLHEQLKKNSGPIDANSENNTNNTENNRIEDHLKSEEIIAGRFENEFSFFSFNYTVFIESFISFVFVPPN